MTDKPEDVPEDIHENFDQLLDRAGSAWRKELPPSIAGRLRAARIDALANSALGTAPPTLAERLYRYRFQGIALAGVTCLALMVSTITQHSVETLELPPVDDLALLITDDDIEFMENIEFILWLAEQEEADQG